MQKRTHANLPSTSLKQEENDETDTEEILCTKTKSRKRKRRRLKFVYSSVEKPGEHTDEDSGVITVEDLSIPESGVKDARTKEYVELHEMTSYNSRSDLIGRGHFECGCRCHAANR